MDRKIVSRLFASAVLVAIAAPAPATGNQNATFTPDQTKSQRDAGQQPEPVVLAQGRCFNGRCY